MCKRCVEVVFMSSRLKVDEKEKMMDEEIDEVWRKRKIKEEILWM